MGRWAQGDLKRYTTPMDSLDRRENECTQYTQGLRHMQEVNANGVSMLNNAVGRAATGVTGA